ncbi:outer membrane lipid asymmetry maintenance protein MlaD [Psychromarinibacter sp. C21-152]|uniref:Outer membrane lipid asymmetry maintenance protein MlaD n=1 Tax=Psychromarinibacter sediminicola TaxID=3033385 RepID=A0AAE3T6F0_9RHOB|nr:outer membrane lipid asymmetry maintenance protein MlaD [Psychromarinibacter sediminicola]MDF0599195.1 outer membrane lipid asymmetry maintenance protein MlaD [Psychromarinibacter sediminicola]
MAERTTEVLVGGVVLAVAAGFLFYAGSFAELGGGGAGAAQYSASFRSAEGVSVGTDVRMAGVKVGSVTAMDLDPQTFRAETTFTVSDDIRLPTDTAVVIASEGLLGGTYMEIVPGGMLEEYAPGDEILDTQSAVSLISLLLKFVGGEGGDSGATGAE